MLLWKDDILLQKPEKWNDPSWWCFNNWLWTSVFVNTTLPFQSLSKEQNVLEDSSPLRHMTKIINRIYVCNRTPDRFCEPTFLCFLCILTGRKRQWFKVDEAIQVLQSHKPVHAEYLRRLTNTSSPACTSVCSTTNGNMQSSQVMDNNTPCYVFCSSQSSDVVNR